MTVKRSFWARSLFFSAVLFGVLFGKTAVSVADVHSFETLYGEGVHAFNTGDYARAVRIFDEAATQGSPDPRGYFYRGLAKLRLGNPDGADEDFEYASSLELSKAGRPYSVSRGLERIQGKERLTIERFRRQAKQKWEKEQDLLNKAEFEAQKKRDRLIYDGIIDQGTKTAGKETSVSGDSPIPFGASAINPFNVKIDVPARPLPTAPPTLTDDNIFKAKLEEQPDVQQDATKRSRGLIIPEEDRPAAVRRAMAERTAARKAQQNAVNPSDGTGENAGGSFDFEKFFGSIVSPQRQNAGVNAFDAAFGDGGTDAGTKLPEDEPVEDVPSDMPPIESVFDENSGFDLP
ncbi:MAG: hypothetical protein LBQ54_04650 [Planctomycetaceae bacterium]|jgi:tetratricopeptide (TPR) repeat protein|nr:hypothetical protein [Planctomycetaceae bacterium]